MEIRTATIPLITEPWERDILFKRMDLCRSIFNSELNEVERRYNAMQRDSEYLFYRNVIDEVYEQTSAGARTQAKDTDVYRDAVKGQNNVFRKYGLTPYSVNNRAIELAKPYSAILPSRVAHFTIGIPLWRAVHSVMMGTQTGFCYKKAGDIHNLSSDGRSGIRLLKANGKSSRTGIEIRAHQMNEKAEYGVEKGGLSKMPAAISVVYGKGKGRHAIRLPLVIDETDMYTIDALSYPFRIIRITRREHQGKDRYFLQLVYEKNYMTSDTGL